ncbi:MAG: MogA/MoaB family molybdenum cofactor biosynthesis protein [Planctomycetota bacterium]
MTVPDEKASEIRAAVLVFSDSAVAGSREDSSGRLIVAELKRRDMVIEDYCILSDDREQGANKLREYADSLRLDLVLTTGGTGFGPRDNAPEALLDVMEREAPGIAEAVRSHGMKKTPQAMLSRARAGLRGDTLIINLPGSAKAVGESLEALFPALLHAFPMIQGKGHDEDQKR